MTTDSPVRIELPPGGEDRFHRLRLIRWWDQAKLANSKVLVVGAGALGNELIKNLALLGVGHVFIADRDRIENSNLSRSPLYRARDNGRFKAEAAAEAARDLYPDLRVRSFTGNAVYDLGAGVFRWADVILGGLDNREARLAINRHAWRLNKPWIDGAIEQIQGTARVFAPDGSASQSPCYECTMSEMDWKLLAHRRSCNLLTRPEMEAGKTPTTPTISSIIAGVQAQEAVKLLHGLPTIAGRGFVFDGLSAEAYQVEFQRKDDCYSHDPLESIVELNAGAATISAKEILAEARKLLGPTAEVEFGRDMLERLVCPNCGFDEPMFCSLGRVAADKGPCPRCPGVLRQVVTFHKIRGDEAFLDRSLADLGVPPFDILVGRTGERAIGLELSVDASTALGPLMESEGLEWT